MDERNKKYTQKSNRQQKKKIFKRLKINITEIRKLISMEIASMKCEQAVLKNEQSESKKEFP